MLVSVPVFLASDNNYAPFVATTIASVCDNTKSFINFYILDGGISNENKSKINNLKNKFNNFSIEFIEIDIQKYFNDFIDVDYISKSMYSRFLIPEITGIDKVLYLDVDIIACSDIVDLYNEDLDGCFVGAVKDGGDSTLIQEYKQRLDIQDSHEYFNSGVLLINCQAWRENKIRQGLYKIEKKLRAQLICPDQDILNKYFENNYKGLSAKYNEMIKTQDKTLLRHYASKEKPWYFKENLKTSLFNDIGLFWKYAKMTNFYEELNLRTKCNTFDDLRLLRVKTRWQKAAIEALGVRG